jgi:hypothetical protein
MNFGKNLPFDRTDQAMEKWKMGILQRIPRAFSAYKFNRVQAAALTKQIVDALLAKANKQPTPDWCSHDSLNFKKTMELPEDGFDPFEDLQLSLDKVGDGDEDQLESSAAIDSLSSHVLVFFCLFFFLIFLFLF